MENPERESGVFSEATAQAGADQPAPAPSAGCAGEDSTADETASTSETSPSQGEQADQSTDAASAGEAGEPEHAGEAQAGEEAGEGDQPDQSERDGVHESDSEGEAQDDSEGQGVPTLADLKGEVAQLSDDLARARAEIYNLDRQYSAYVRRAKQQAASHREDGRGEVVEALLSVLDDIEAARQAGELSGPFAAIAQKLEQALATGFEVVRYGEAGEEFDPTHHDALMAQETDEVEVATIAQVLQPGYRMGERVLRPTKVMVHNPA